MEPLLPKLITVNDGGQAVLAQVEARTYALETGFDTVTSEQIALCASELATNLVRHAGGGTIRFSRAEDQGRVGLQLEAEDIGPGIADIEQAVTDGYSTGGGLGIGLGTISRFMDDLELNSAPLGGTHVLCRRWIRPQGMVLFSHPFAYGVATRSRWGAPENGDTFVVKRWLEYTLVGVIDGLGHGDLAKRAAQAARAYVEDHYDQPLESVFRGVERACRSTRGVVMALCRFDLARDVFAMASVGNIEARLSTCGAHGNFVVRRGIIGAQAPKPVITEHAWDSDSILVLHSDGLHSRWNWNDCSPNTWNAPAEAAQFLLQAQGKDEDDATVVVVRSAKT